MSQLPQAPSKNPTYGSGQFPGKRSASGPPTYNDIAATTADVVGTGRSGQLIVPANARRYSPTGSATSGDVVATSFRVPSIGEAKYVNINARTNGFTTYSRKARAFKDSDLKADLLETGMIINTFKDKNTTAIAARTNYEHYRHDATMIRRDGTKGNAAMDFMYRRPLGNRHLMFDPIRTNYLLASTEPYKNEQDQFQAWTIHDVLNKWKFCDGVVLNQEGGPSRDGRNYDEGKDKLLNMVVHGRIEGVLNLWGENLKTDSELYFVIKRVPIADIIATGGYVLDPTFDSMGYYGNMDYSHQGLMRMPKASDNVRAKASNSAENLVPGAYLTGHPFQICPFHPSKMNDRPTYQDTLGVDDNGNVVEGAVIRVGKVWFPGTQPTTYHRIKHLQPLTNMADYLRCGVITVLTDNHGFNIRK